MSGEKIGEKKLEEVSGGLERVMMYLYHCPRCVTWERAPDGPRSEWPHCPQCGGLMQKVPYTGAPGYVE